MTGGERLYQLLPAVYRRRDAGAGLILRALLDIIGRDLEGIEDDIGLLYEDWFIETCADWVVPYIGDLVGVRGLVQEPGNGLSLRAFVGNTIAHRRRKGTAAVLEKVAQDVTGWPARAVEYFELVAATQFLDHPRPGSGGAVDLRNRAALVRLGTSSDQVARTADVRRIGTAGGGHNLPNVGLFLWRVESFPLEKAELRPLQDSPGEFRFHPAAADTPLLNRPRPREASLGLATEADVPDALTLDRLTTSAVPADEALRAAGVRLYKDGVELMRLPDGSARVVVCPLPDGAPDSGVKAAIGNAAVCVDPELGRLFVQNQADAAARWTADFAYGFPGRLGGGPYDRRASAEEQELRWEELTELKFSPFVATVAAPGSAEALPGAFLTLADAIAAWKNSTVPHAEIRLIGNSIHVLDDAAVLDLGTGGHVLISAADGARPALIGPLRIRAARGMASVRLNGLMLDGQVIYESDVPLLVDATDCTLTHGIRHGGQSGSPQLEDVFVNLARSVSGPLRLAGEGISISVMDSIVDAGIVPLAEGDDGRAPGDAIPALRAGDDTLVESIGVSGHPGSPLVANRSTVIGVVRVRELSAAETIFTHPVFVQNEQTGSVRFTYAHPDSHLPVRRYRCQPEFSLNGEALKLERIFTSLNYGNLGYLQLGPECPPAISAGAENGSETGAHRNLLAPLRANNLRAALDDFLPAGLELGVFHVT